MPVEDYDRIETFELTKEDQAKIEAAKKEAEEMTLTLTPTTITNEPRTINYSLPNKPTPIYCIPYDTLIRSGNGSVMTYGQLEDMRYKYENALSRISQILKEDLQGYPI